MRSRKAITQQIWSIIKETARRTLSPCRMSVQTLHARPLVTTTTTNCTTSAERQAEIHKERRIVPRVRGMDVINDPRINKGLAFSLEERQILGIMGLIPPAFFTQEQQVYRVLQNIKDQPNDLGRYVQLNALQDRNEKLFYRVLCENVTDLMPIVYTPTVGEACKKFGFIYRRPKGLYISIHDRKPEQIHAILQNWPEVGIKAVVVTDGERILGLGDLGAYGMGIPIGKLALYVALGGFQPRWCLPVTLDVGTNNEELLKDPFYTGLKHERIRGAEYDEFIDNFIQAVMGRYGQQTLIQFEDFGNINAFRLLERYRNEICTFNDDIQGTASVVLAGLFAGMRKLNKQLKDNKILFFGAGQAAVGIAQLICAQMVSEGVPEEVARKNIWMMDYHGLLVKSRNDLTENQKPFAHDFEPMRNDQFEEVLDILKPNILLGAATVGGTFTENVIRKMATYNERPIIFALSNPTPCAECTAEQAYTYSDGRAIFSSGSPFDPVTIKGKTYYPGQGNNASIFPGLAVGVVLTGTHHITNELFLIAAKEVAHSVHQEDLDEGRLFPPLDTCRELSVRIATKIAEYCYANGMASHYPEPTDKESFIRNQLYTTEYQSFLPEMYKWPEETMHPVQVDF